MTKLIANLSDHFEMQFNTFLKPGSGDGGGARTRGFTSKFRKSGRSNWPLGMPPIIWVYELDLQGSVRDETGTDQKLWISAFDRR